MRTRGLVAAVVGAAGAGLARALDVAGLLPGVHESEAVRSGMGPAATGTWLLLAGALAWLVGITGRWWVGVASCVFVGGIPELITRHDPEAMGEPGALMGALVQLLLLLILLALAVVIDLELRRTRQPRRSWQLHRAPLLPAEPMPRGAVRRLDANPRGPPAASRPALSH
jgi:hypothetical protein